MNLPKTYPKSEDVIDRSHGEKPTLSERARDLSITARNAWEDTKEDWQTMKAIERSKDTRRNARRASRR